MIAKQVRPR